jgi:hypothetical protein
MRHGGDGSPRSHDGQVGGGGSSLASFVSAHGAEANLSIVGKQAQAAAI